MKNNKVCGKLRKGANFAAAKNNDDRTIDQTNQNVNKSLPGAITDLSHLYFDQIMTIMMIIIIIQQ